MNLIKGRVWKYGDDVNTDVIFPGKYVYSVSDPSKMAVHALEDLDPEFVKAVRPGDIVIAGKNWGCGSSREQAVTCLKESKLGAIVAKSFGRIYYRNCLNAALPALTCQDAAEKIQDGEIIEIDLKRGEIRYGSGILKFPPLPEQVMGIFAAGGLVEYTRERLLSR